jgi:hypothetical protein
MTGSFLDDWVHYIRFGGEPRSENCRLKASNKKYAPGARRLGKRCQREQIRDRLSAMASDRHWAGLDLGADEDSNLAAVRRFRREHNDQRRIHE